MKTLQQSFEFFNFQKFCPVLLLSTLFAFANKESPETSNSNKNSLLAFKESKVFHGFFKAAESLQQENTENNSSIFKKVFAGIGSFFVFLGTGIGRGIVSSAKFLGRVIVFPVTFTFGLFSSKKEASSSGSPEGGSSNTS